MYKFDNGKKFKFEISPQDWAIPIRLTGNLRSNYDKQLITCKLLNITQVNSIEPNPITCIANGTHKSALRALSKLSMLSFRVY